MSESKEQLPDACKDSELIPFESIRLYAYERLHGEPPICDRNLIQEAKWYRATDDMVTNATRANICGTTYPLWLSGTIPTSKMSIGKEEDGIVCVPGVRTACDYTFSIKIMNCGTYRVYKLKKPDSCPQAYCFGYGVKDTPPTQKTSKPKVQHEFTRDNSGFLGSIQVSNFKCDFNFLSDAEPNKPYLYQVYWYINGEIVYVTEAVKKEEFTKTFLNENNGKYKMGIQISCSVKLKFHSRGLPGPMSEKSNDFFAGIKLTSQSINIPRGESRTIGLTFTVPFPCGYTTVQSNEIDELSCPLNVELAFPKGKGGSCESRLALDGGCGTTFHAKSWNKTEYIAIIHQDTGNYKLTLAEAERKIYLKTYGFDKSDAWKDVLLPVVNVHIDDTKDQWKGSSCTAHSDPHMKTFDQISYDNQNSGTFIMYRNIDSDGNVMEVQTELTFCNHGTHIFCVCGIAVRAAGDVFVINRCPHLRRNVFAFRSCIDNILDVRKIDELNYKIYMPSGTYVQTRLWLYNDKNVMEIDIFPSRADIDKSEGLCSKLGSRKLYKRDGSVYPYRSGNPDNFSLSWRVEDADNLLEMPDENVTQLSPLRSSYVLCTCENHGSTILNETVCSKDKTISCDVFKTKRHQKNTCFARRKRRSLQANLSFIPNNFVQHTNRRKRSTFNETKVVWTKDEAKSFCINYMNESAGYKACLGVPNVTPENAIADCVADIQLTNTTSWAIASREGLKALCFKELSQNNTFQNETENDGVSVMESILSVSCPSECHQRGICENGTCICNEDYGAADCSINLRDPPVVNGVNLDSGGLCDKLHCSEAVVEGDLFLDRTTLTCKMQRFNIPYQGNHIFLETVKVEAQHNSISDVICPFPKLRKKRSTTTTFISGFKIAVSNDGKAFSPSHFMYILDSTCQDTMNVSGEIRFALKDGFCFINGRCIADGTQDGSNICNICKYKSNAFNWSRQTNNSGCKEASSKLWIIGAVIGFVAMVLCVGIVFFICKKKSRIIGTTPPPSYKQ